ncbi:hypothetical protein GQ600_15618 [Phytophthora cactorum]|nr:hypothetical protein GQ600_15618 [Phytophthora cactorum]
MAMQYLWGMIKICREGMPCYSWLLTNIDEQCTYQDAGVLAKRIIDLWPNERLHGGHTCTVPEKNVVPRQPDKRFCDDSRCEVSQQHYNIPTSCEDASSR